MEWAASPCSGVDMTIRKVDFKADGRNIRETFTGSYIQTVTRTSRKVIVQAYPVTNLTGTVTFQALSDNKTDTAIEIMQSPLLPQLGNYFVDEKGVVWRSLLYKERAPRYIGVLGNFFLWEVTYTLEGTNSQNNAEQEDTTVLLNFNASIETFDEAGTVDLDGKYNTNSFGLFFDDPLIYKRGILNLEYSRTEYSTPLSTMLNYLGCINSENLWGFSRGTVRLADMSYTANVTKESTSYDVKYKLQYRPDGWGVTKVNSSYYYRGQDGNIYRALNADGSPNETPILIALDGTPLSSMTMPPSISFRVYDYANLADLDLPNPFNL